MSLIQLIDFALMVYGSIFPLFLAHKARGAASSVFYLSLSLGLMAFIHSLYHLSLFFEETVIAATLHLISILIVIVIGTLYLRGRT